MASEGREGEGQHAATLSGMSTRGPSPSATPQPAAGTRASPASSTSTGLGVKRISQPDSPQLAAAEPARRDERVDSLPLTAATATKELTEEEWARGSSAATPIAPPYPLALVSRVCSITDRVVRYLYVSFLQREHPLPDRLAESRFRRKNVPSISIGDYLQRICNYVVALEPSMVLAVLAYAHMLDPSPMDHGHRSDGSSSIPWERDECSGEKTDGAGPRETSLLRIDSFTVHRFLITSITLASKALGDHYYSNAFYAKVGGISTKELNHLELELAMLLDWRLQVSRDTLQRLWSQLDHAGG